VSGVEREAKYRTKMPAPNWRFGAMVAGKRYEIIKLTRHHCAKPL